MAGDNFGSIGAKGNTAFHRFATSFAGRLVYGYVSGGIASEATGGDFLMGAATGAIVALANHWLHGINNGGNQQKKFTFQDAVDHWRGGSGTGHTAVAIDHPDGTTKFVSKDGVIDSNGDGEHDNFGIFGKSAYTDSKMKFKNLSEILKAYPEYLKSLTVRINASQAVRAYKAAVSSAKSYYFLAGFSKSCIDVPTMALHVAFNTSIPFFDGYSDIPNLRFYQFPSTFKNQQFYFRRH